MTTQVIFDTFAKVTGGAVGTAPDIFVATSDQLASVLTTAGAIADMYAAGIVKAKDIIFVNGDMDGTPFQNVYTVTATSSGSLTPYTAAVGGSLLAANNLSDVVSVSTSLSNLGLASNQVKYASVAVSAAEFNGMYATPKLLVAAGGANTLHVLQRAYAFMTYGSAAFASGGTANIQYDSTVHAGGTAASTGVIASQFQATASTAGIFVGTLGGSNSTAFSTSVNKGLYLSNGTGAFTTGDSSFVFHVFYNTIATV